MSDEFEKKVKDDFRNVEDHIKRILTIIDKHTQMIEILEERIETIENNIDYARFEIQEQRLDSLEKKLEEYSDYMVKVRRIQQDNTKQIAELGEKLQKCGVRWDFRLDELGGFIDELKAIEKVSLDTIEVISKDYKNIKKILREFYSLTDSLASYFASKYETRIALTIRTHRKRIKEKLDSKSGGEKEEQICKSCEEYDICVYEFKDICDYCPNRLDVPYPGKEQPRVWMGEVPLTYANEKKEDFTDSKLPEPLCKNCKHGFPIFSERCKSCNNNDKFEPKEKTEPKKVLYPGIYGYIEPKTEPEKDPYGIEGKYGVWTKQELINECNVLVSNMDALHELHLKEKGELIEEFLKDMKWLNDGFDPYPSDPLDILVKKWQGRLKK